MTILNCECGNEIFIMDAKPKQRPGSASSAVSGMISSV